MYKCRLFSILSFVTAFAISAYAVADSSNPVIYKAGQVNQPQNLKKVEINALAAVKIEADNVQGKQAAQVGDSILGGLLSSAVGSRYQNSPVVSVASGLSGTASMMVPDKTLIDGVQITYAEDSNLKISVQIAQLCEFKIGSAIAVSSLDGSETRIQPNNDTPCQK